ncbi:unnamed protein product [Symbiodinium microadriaticum]|nr:unnamed protein product [Symbiodinium microadriaticum]
MQEQVESEAKEDEETYDKFKCWCHECCPRCWERLAEWNTVAKEKAVKEAEAATRELKDRVEVLLAKSERLKQEVENAEDERAKNENALDTARLLRRQQNQDFVMFRFFVVLGRLGDYGREGVPQVRKAKAAFTNEEGAAFLQARGSSAKPLLQQLMARHTDKLSSDDRETLQSFLQRGDGVDGVVGVLTGLKDDFSQELTQLEADEATSLKQYEELAAAKSAEIKAGTKQIEAKKEERAATNEEPPNFLGVICVYKSTGHVAIRTEIKDTEGVLGSDLSFVGEVKKQCAEMDAEWDERQKTRGEEAEAISKAIEILDADEAHANFEKTFATSFLQESAVNTRAERAAEVLATAGRRDPRMAALATQVKKAMDDMVFALQKEQEDEVTQKDYCVEEFRENKLKAEGKTRLKATLVAKENAIDIETPKTEQETYESEVAEMQKQLKLAGQNREKENTQFQKVIAEQRETQRLLKEALVVLGKFYNKESLIQVHAEAGPESPGGFEDYKSNGKSFGVMTMLQTLVEDSAAMEKEAIRAERSAQKAYEGFAADTTDSVAKKEAAIASKKAEKAKLKKTLTQTRKARKGAEKSLDSLAQTKAELHESCDFLLANFDARQAAREDEMDSVKKAKAILSGATFAEIQLD